MSEMELGKTHIDALVTAALVWSEHAVGYNQFQRYEFVDPFPESPTYRRRMALTEATADLAGACVLVVLMRAKFEQHPDLAERLVTMGAGGPFHAERHADGWLHEPLTPHLTSTLLAVIRGELSARRPGLIT